MAMAILYDDASGIFSASDDPDSLDAPVAEPPQRQMRLPLIMSKLRAPEPQTDPQQRLLGHLDRSVSDYAGTLIIGRAGSGKTTLAASFCSRVESSLWYSVDAGDADWSVFSEYFRQLMLKDLISPTDTSARTPLELVSCVTAALDLNSRYWPEIMVMDEAHHLFDSGWFTEFFDLLMLSLPPPAHVLLLSRSKPPGPLWRLRSKQILNVIDERALSLSLAETEDLFERSGLSRREAIEAHRASYGHPGKITRIIGSFPSSVIQR